VKPVGPVLGHDAKVMDGAAYDSKRFTIFDEVVPLNLKASSLHEAVPRDSKSQEDQDAKKQTEAHLVASNSTERRLLGMIDYDPAGYWRWLTPKGRTKRISRSR